MFVCLFIFQQSTRIQTTNSVLPFVCWVLISVQFSKSLVCCSGSALALCLVCSTQDQVLDVNSDLCQSTVFKALQGPISPVLLLEIRSFSWGFVCPCCHGCCNSTTGAIPDRAMRRKKTPKTRISFCCSCFLLVLLGPYTLANARRGDRKKLHRKHLPMSHFFKILLFFTNLPAFAFFSES